jgi:8-amino-7-oxononanoate synthase
MMQDQPPAIFQRLEELEAMRLQLAEVSGVDPFSVQFDRPLSATEALWQGRPITLFGSNNYLGLSFDDACQEAACRAVREEGTGTTGSRMANGSFASHRALEEELAHGFGFPSCTVFSAGYLANLGVIATLAGDVVVLDAESHASIYDGARLSGADIVPFRHNDPDDLDRRLRRLGTRARGAPVVVEGLYSMMGDTAPIAELVAVKERHGALLVVDEAHSFGVLGARGCGKAEADGVLERVDMVVGTFSKSLAGVGGFATGPHPQWAALRLASRPYIFTASPSPATVAATRQALAIITSERGAALRERLNNHARRLHAGLLGMGWRLGAEPGPVIAVLLEDAQHTLRLWRALLEQGYYVNMMIPPAAPRGLSLLRLSLSAAHQAQQIDALLAAFAALRQDRV